MLKIIWISNRLFEHGEDCQSGVWLKALAMKLVKSDMLILANVSTKSGIKNIEKCDYNNLNQWALPKPKINRKGYPDKKSKLMFGYVINEFQPDIIQIWGSENPFRLLPFSNEYPGIKVLTMQGVLSSMSASSLLWFNLNELISTVGIREIVKGQGIIASARSFIRDGAIENIMINRSRFIISQSEWTDSQILAINPNVHIYHTHRVLRHEFIECEKWYLKERKGKTIYTAALGYSWKALHVLIKALPIVKTQVPNFKLRIAGLKGRTDFLGDGYIKYILRFIRRNDLSSNIIWLGPLNAGEIVRELQDASVFVNPSNVESYSNTLAEAMSVGTPSVVAFAGAMPELAENNKEALYFTPGDYKRCAYLIIRLLTDKELSVKLSINAVNKANERNVKIDIAQHQLDIYKDILRKESIKL